MTEPSAEVSMSLDEQRALLSLRDGSADSEGGDMVSSSSLLVSVISFSFGVY